MVQIAELAVNPIHTQTNLEHDLKTFATAWAFIGRLHFDSSSRTLAAVLKLQILDTCELCIP